MKATIKKASENEPEGILGYTEDQVVSNDVERDTVTKAPERQQFRAFWAVVALLHVYCVLHLSVTTFLFWYVDQPSLTYFAYLIAPSGNGFFTQTAVVFGIVAAFHVWSLLDRWQALLIGRQGIFGIESPHFATVFVIRECVECGFLTLQAYSTTKRLAKAQLNNAFVAFVIAHCWTHPLLSMFLHRSPALERIGCILLDLFFTIGSNMIIPSLVLKPYYDAYIPEYFSFELALFYDEVWFANLVMELRFLFSTSLVDVLSKLIPHLAVLLCLSNIKLLVKRAKLPDQPRTSKMKQTKSNQSGSKESKPSAVSAVEPMKPSAGAKSKSKKTVGRPSSETLRRGWQVFSRAVFLVWGLSLLVIHAVAVSRRPSEDMAADGCRKPMQPWLVRRKACLVLEYNCYRRGVPSLEPGVLEEFDSHTLAALMFTHCPALTVTDSIHHFPNAIGIEVYNSTIVRWGLEAAVVSRHLPSIMYVLIIRTGMSAPLEGLLQRIPQSLIDIEFSITNLTTLPGNIDELWAPVLTLFIEYSNFTRIPEPLLRLPIGDLSFIGNNVTQLPEFSSSGTGYYMLSLADNPLTTLPQSLTELPVLGAINLINTQLATLPSWIDDLVSTKSTQVMLKGTPFCRAKSDAEMAAAFGVDAKISCEYTDDRTDGRYPLALMTPLRPL
ncbi:hypothetical protein P43SY_007916 [Pythium insidiosum]|uniref:Uncharacterized protein n=1 Tax=Pythium insidiosum TaxID=114742 RepID=A0AAD5M581_PYTIN|nr:hypothetical protein P43SY_007916 [Pythium insidiosum]